MLIKVCFVVFPKKNTNAATAISNLFANTDAPFKCIMSDVGRSGAQRLEKTPQFHVLLGAQKSAFARDICYFPDMHCNLRLGCRRVLWNHSGTIVERRILLLRALEKWKSGKIGKWNGGDRAKNNFRQEEEAKEEIQR